MVAQGTDASPMHWRAIGPTRAGRARAARRRAAASRTSFYIGFDNGGVWRSTDYGSTWVPLFDTQPTGSIGAIAVAPSDPNIIYVGTGAGIIRPDLATGDGMYKSTDAGKTWTHLGLRDTPDDREDRRRSRRIPNRLFVAALGHPVRPECRARHLPLDRRRHRRSRRSSTRTSTPAATTSASIRANPNIVYAALWQQQQSFIEGGGFGGAGDGIFKSTDGGTTWKQLTDGLPPVIQANLAIAPSNPKYDLRDGRGGTAAPARGGGRAGGAADAAAASRFYKTTDGGEHWALVNRPIRRSATRRSRRRRRSRIRVRSRASAAAICRRITVDPKNENVVYSCSTVFWRTEDGGLTWSAVRGAPGGDDYQKLGQPEQPEHHSRRRRPGRRRLGQSRRVVEQLVHPADRGDVSRHRPTTRSPIASAAASRTPARPASTAAATTARSRSTTGIR